MRFPVVVFVLLVMVSMPVAAEIQPVDDIRQAAVDFVLSQYEADNVSASADRLDDRLRLARCDRELSAFAATAAAAGGNQSVGVRCEGERPWTIYVPVRVTRSEDVVVLARPLQRDAVLAAEDLTTVQRDVAALSAGYFTRPEDLVGHRVKRSVAAGTVLTPVIVHRPPLIARGDRVTLVSGGSAVSVRAPGEALGDGRRGDRLRVRNLSSGKVVEGVIRGRGHVEVFSR